MCQPIPKTFSLRISFAYNVKTFVNIAGAGKARRAWNCIANRIIVHRTKQGHFVRARLAIYGAANTDLTATVQLNHSASFKNGVLYKESAADKVSRILTEYVWSLRRCAGDLLIIKNHARIRLPRNARQFHPFIAPSDVVRPGKRALAGGNLAEVVLGDECGLRARFCLRQLREFRRQILVRNAFDEE